MASLTFRPPMNRRAMPPGPRMPYREAASLTVRLPASARNSRRETASSTVEGVRSTGR